MEKFKYNKVEDENTNILHIASKDCIKPTNNTNHIICNLNTPITCEEHEIFEITLLTASIPYSFYAINYSNKYLDVKERVNGIDSFFTIFIEEGNYNSITFLNKVKTELNNMSPNGIQYVIDYNKVTNKGEFDYNNNIPNINEVVFLFQSGANSFFNLQTVMGFYQEIDMILPMVSTSTMNLNPYANIFIHSPSLGITNSFDSMSKQNTTIIAKIPVNVAPFSNIFYENDLFTKYISGITSIGSIELALRDEFQLPIDMNQNDWFCTMKIKKLNHNFPILTRENIDKLFFGE